MKVHYYDKISGRDIDERTVKKRLKLGMIETICVYMMYEDYEELIHIPHSKGKKEERK